MSQCVEPILEDEKIYQKIVELYETKPKFILHIFRSFFPVIKVKRVESFSAENLRNRRCCISDQSLIDLHHAAQLISKKSNIPYDLTLISITDVRTMIQQIEVDINECNVNKRVALIGQNTDKMLCINAYNQLRIFIKDMFNKRDKHFMSIVYKEFCEAYKDDINKRFDTSVKFFKTSPSVKSAFNIFIKERIIQGINLNYESVWETVSGREYIKHDKNESKNTKRYGRQKEFSKFSKRPTNGK